MRLSILTIALAAAGAVSAAEPPRVVAVLPINSTRAYLDDAGRVTLDEGIRSTTVDSLAPLGITVASPEAARAAMAATLTTRDQLCDEACARQVARRLNADYFVTGAATQSEGEYTAFIRLNDAREGQQVGAVEVSGASVRDLRKDFAEEAPKFFARTLGNDHSQPAEAAPSQTTVVVPVPVQSEPAEPPPAVVVVPQGPPRLSIFVEGDAGAYDIEVFHANGKTRCGRVDFVKPCELADIPPGPVRIRAVGAGTFLQEVVVPEDGVKVTFWHTPDSLLYPGMGLLGIGTALLIAPHVGEFNSSEDNVFYAGAAVAGAAGVALVAIDLTKVHDGIRVEPKRPVKAENERAWVPSGVKVKRTDGGAALSMKWKF